MQQSAAATHYKEAWARRRVAVAALLLALAYAGGLLMFLLDRRLSADSVGEAVTGGPCLAVTVASSVRPRSLPSPADVPPHA